MTPGPTRYIVVTGTDTSVGKTVVTAALAVALEAQGHSVAVVKPAQTGVGPGETGDIETIVALTGVTDVHEPIRLELPLAPESAALAVGALLPTVADHAEAIRRLSAEVVLIEGAGGLLVRLDLAGRTIRDLALELQAEVVLVAREGLGTLNHVALTLASLTEVGLTAEVVLGCCSSEPGLAERSNRMDIPRLLGRPLMGELPDGAGALPREEFRAQAPGWFAASQL